MRQYAGSRHVFDGIEFYLPQLAHMIIHLEVEWDDAILERFALVIAQQSVHFALQLNWILKGALEDYKPEYDDGTPNEKYSPMFYSRCLKLLKNVERCIVYGKPRAADFQRLYEQGKITKDELKILELSDRHFNALQITDANAHVEIGALDGTLLVKLPPTEKSKGTAFVTRFCVLEKGVLNVYLPKRGCAGTFQLERAMSLARVVIQAVDECTVRVVKTHYNFELKCSSPQEANLWTRRLREEADESTFFQSEAVKKDLTPDQLERFSFFENERKFVKDLTQIAEDLRELDREHRKANAPGLMKKLKIPETVYLPLCNSSDIWRRVSDTLHKETRVFNTKERCPVVMHFISKRGETTKGAKTDPNLDVAEYMHAYFEVSDDAEPLENLEETKEEDEEVEAAENGQRVELEEGNKENDGDGSDKDNEMRASSHGSIANVWQEDEEHGDHAKKGNRVQKLLRESVISVPSRISKRLGGTMNRRGSSRLISVMDRQTEVQPLVPILEGSRGAQAADELDNASVGDGTVVSVERSSVLIKDQLVLGSLDEGDIDFESISRASQSVCGGVLWAEKSAAMLEEAKKEKAELTETEMVQMEVISCLAKSNDDLRQEVFIMQMIHYYKSVFAQAKLPLWLKTYRILSTSSSEGLIELLTDATSIDGLKKSEDFPTEGGLRVYFEKTYGRPDSKAFKAAQTNFMQSLAGYAVVAYLLGLKDRHNGNIMIDTRGHLIFIDFGFAMGMAPGHEFSMERAPFKLTKEYVEVMGGVKSDCYKEFERLFVAGFEEARKNYQVALGLVEIMMFKSNYPCFAGWRYGNGKALTRFEKRLMLDVPDKLVKKKALKLIRRSKQHFGTYLYDAFQKATNGYAI